MRQLLADKVSGNLVGTWLLIPEHLRLGVWDLLCGWTGCSGARIEPRMALQLVHEAALCNTGLRRLRSLSQRGFELANGLPFVVTDTAVHDLLAAHTIAEAQEVQVALGRIRKASGHFPGRLLALDPHRLTSTSKRSMQWRKADPEAPAQKVVQTFFCLDAESKQPLCFALTSSGSSVSQASPQVLTMADRILNSPPGRTLVMADSEHYSDDLIQFIQQRTPFDILMPPRVTARVRRATASVPDSDFHRHWAGFATAKIPFRLDEGHSDDCWLYIQRCGEKPSEFRRKAFLCTADRSELTDLTANYPKRWNVEEYFGLEQAMGWNRAGTLNMNIRYAAMTAALIAQASLSQLRPRLGPHYANWEASHIARAVLSGLEGDIRVKKDTIIVTYYNAPLEREQQEQFTDLPDRLRDENVSPNIPWLYDLKLDFRFR